MNKRDREKFLGIKPCGCVQDELCEQHRAIDTPKVCGTCGSDDPKRHAHYEGRPAGMAWCPDAFHRPQEPAPLGHRPECNLHGEPACVWCYGEKEPAPEGELDNLSVLRAAVRSVIGDMDTRNLIYDLVQAERADAARQERRRVLEEIRDKLADRYLGQFDLWLDERIREAGEC